MLVKTNVSNEITTSYSNHVTLALENVSGPRGRSCIAFDEANQSMWLYLPADSNDDINEEFFNA